MEKLIYIDRRNLKKYRQKTAEIFLALLTGISFVLCFAGILGINFSITDWNNGGIKGGFACFINQMADSLLINDGIVLQKLTGVSETCGFFMFVFMLICGAISYILLQIREKRVLLIFPVIVVLSMMITSAEPNIYSLIFFAAVITTDISFIRLNGEFSLASIVQTAIVFAAVICLFTAPVTSKIFNKSSMAVKAGESIKEFVSDLYYGKSPLGEGVITGKKREINNNTALEVKVSKLEATYLRGFVGENYQSGKWEHLPYSVYDKSRKLMYWLDKNGFYGIGQLGNVQKLIASSNTKAYEVNVKDASKRYAYIPYELKRENSKWINWYNSYITAGNFKRMKTYKYDAYEDVSAHWTKAAGELLTSTDEESVKVYLENESWFNEFVYENYTYLSPSEMKLMREYAGNRGYGREGHLEYKQAVEKVRSYLNENFVYTDDPVLSTNTACGNGDIMEAFFKEHKGYDIHYATAATFMFRYYGIPARYVEGYLITLEDIKKAKPGERIAVPQENIHAWTEIYIDGLGFVPIEVSPKYYDIMPQADMTIGFENSILNKTFEPSYTKSESKIQQQTKNENSKNDLNFRKILIILLFVVLSFLLLLTILKAATKIKTVYERKLLFEKGETKKAVSAIFAYMDDIGLNIDEEVKVIGNKASYSTEEITENDRAKMLNWLCVYKKEKKKERKNAKRKSKK